MSVCYFRRKIALATRSLTLDTICAPTQGPLLTFMKIKRSAEPGGNELPPRPTQRFVSHAGSRTGFWTGTVNEVVAFIDAAEDKASKPFNRFADLSAL
jgi:hypothetical protein